MTALKPRAGETHDITHPLSSLPRTRVLKKVADALEASGIVSMARIPDEGETREGVAPRRHKPGDRRCSSNE
jgi:hypothetical protein